MSASGRFGCAQDPATLLQEEVEAREVARQGRLEATRRWEPVRACCMNLAQTGSQSLILLVAVKHFQAGETYRAWLAAGASVGFLATPFSNWAVVRSGMAVTRVNALLFALSAAGFLLAGLGTGLGMYFGGLMLGLPMISLSMPNTTTLWRQNAPESLRGRLFSTVSLYGRLGGLLGTLVITAWMGSDSTRYRPVFLALSLALAVAAWSSYRTPSLALPSERRIPLYPLSYLWKDRLFGYVAAAWMLMGFGNLAILPLRVDYISDRRHGLDYAPWLVLLLTSALPEISCLLTIRFWGRMFDRMNFVWMRMILNLFFAASAFLFFAPRIELQAVSSLLLGLGYGGGEIAWNLWVTKVAPPDRTADYMEVHTFLTGLRGIVAPSIAYLAATSFSVQWVSWVATGMILLSSLMLIRVLPFGERARARQES